MMNLGPIPTAQSVRNRPENFTPMAIKLTKIQHVGIPATNLAMSKLFYDQLGFTLTMGSAFFYEGAEGQVAMMKSGEITIDWSHGCKYFTILGPDAERLEFNQIL